MLTQCPVIAFDNLICEKMQKTKTRFFKKIVTRVLRMCRPLTCVLRMDLLFVIVISAAYWSVNYTLKISFFRPRTFVLHSILLFIYTDFCSILVCKIHVNTFIFRSGTTGKDSLCSQFTKVEVWCLWFFVLFLYLVFGYKYGICTQPIISETFSTKL